MTTGLNLAFFGSTLGSARGNVATSYYRGIVCALAGRGHHVTFYEPEEPGRATWRDFAAPERVRIVPFAPTEEGAARRIEEARRADVIVKASDIGVLDGFLERALLETRRSSALAVFWDADAPATLTRLREHPDDALAALLPRYDVVFVGGGGDPVVAGHRALGVRTVVPIHEAFDPEVHAPARTDPKFACDLAFLGDRGTDREARIDEFFLRAARWAPSRSFLLGGAGWDGKAVGPNVRRLGRVPARDEEALHVTPLALLDVSRENVAASGWFPGTGVFASAGAGACLITDADEGIADFFEPGSEVLVAGSGSEVAAHLEHLTRTEAREIGCRARARMLADHTWAHRAREVEAAFEGRLEHATSRPRARTGRLVRGIHGAAAAKKPSGRTEHLAG